MAATSNNSSKSNSMRIAVIAGDGIGREVVPEGIRVLEAVGSRFGLSYKWDAFDWSCERFHKTLLDEFRIFTFQRTGLAKGDCVRVTPTLFNTPADLDKLASAVRTIAMRG